MGISSNLTLVVTNMVNTFKINEKVAGVDSANVVVARGSVSRIFGVVGGNSIIQVTNTQGIFLTNSNIYGLTSNTSANLYSLTLDIGVINVSSSFSNLEFNYITGDVSSSNCTLLLTSSGTGGTVNVSTNSLLYTETVNVNSDLVRDYFNVAIEAESYGFPANTSANLATTNVAFCFSYGVEEVGKAFILSGISPGSQYSKAPIIRVYDQLAAGANKKDLKIYFTGADSGFQVGEVVTQEYTETRALIKSISSDVLSCESLSILNLFIPTINSTTTIVGTSSGTTANILSTEEITSSDAAGLNMDLGVSVQVNPGAISSLYVLDSGFGFEQDEIVTITINDNDSVASGFAELGKHGRGTGYYREKGGFLDDQKKLYDGYYYQEYSYEILSSINLNKYRDMLVNVMHFAGTKLFGALIKETTANTNISINNTEISIT
jgi:hypothetical protein